MLPTEIADLFIETTSRIEFCWNLFVVILIALVGWRFQATLALGGLQRIILTLGYGGFAAVNIPGLFGTYTLAEALLLDFQETDALETLGYTDKALRTIDYAQQRTVMFFVHGFVALLVLAAIWIPRQRLAAH